MKQRPHLRTDENEWRSSYFGTTQPRVRIGKPPKVLHRANWLGRLVDSLAQLLSAKRP